MKIKGILYQEYEPTPDNPCEIKGFRWLYGNDRRERMKIIDLLNKIAKGEEVPKKIKYNDDIYIHVGEYCYFCEETNEILSQNIYAEISRLNDEIEIIEEPKDKWEKLKIWLKEYAFKNLESKGIVLTTDEVLNQMAGLDDEEEPDLFEMIEDMKNKPKHIEEIALNNEGDIIYYEDGEKHRFNTNKQNKYFAHKINELTKAVNYLFDKDERQHRKNNESPDELN